MNWKLKMALTMKQISRLQNRNLQTDAWRLCILSMTLETGVHHSAALSIRQKVITWFRYWYQYVSLKKKVAFSNSMQIFLNKLNIPDHITFFPSAMSYKTYISEYCPLSAESSDCTAEKSKRSVGVLILSRLYWFDTDSTIGIDIIHVSLPSFCILECVFVCVYFMGPCVVRPLFIHFDHGMIKDVTITCCLMLQTSLFSQSH